MKTKPSVSLLLFSVAALAFVGMLSFSEYAFLCRMVILACVAAIVAVKLSNGHLERILFGKLTFGLNRNIGRPVLCFSADYFAYGYIYSGRFLWFWVEIDDSDEGEGE